MKYLKIRNWKQIALYRALLQYPLLPIFCFVSIVNLCDEQNIFIFHIFSLFITNIVFLYFFKKFFNIQKKKITCPLFILIIPFIKIQIAETTRIVYDLHVYIHVLHRRKKTKAFKKISLLSH